MLRNGIILVKIIIFAVKLWYYDEQAAEIIRRVADARHL
jgi:hypothetical protein